MSCSTVSDVNEASSPSWWDWMSCAGVQYISEPRGEARQHAMMQDPIVIISPAMPSVPGGGMLHSLWGAFQQAFTVEDVFQRKIK